MYTVYFNEHCLLPRGCCTSYSLSYSVIIVFYVRCALVHACMCTLYCALSIFMRNVYPIYTLNRSFVSLCTLHYFIRITYMQPVLLRALSISVHYLIYVCTLHYFIRITYMQPVLLRALSISVHYLIYVYCLPLYSS